MSKVKGKNVEKSEFYHSGEFNEFNSEIYRDYLITIPSK